MSSRTPIRLTPHRGPLATPSTTPESSPVFSTPPSDISHSSTATRSSFDVAALRHRMSTLSPYTQDLYRSHLYLRAHRVAENGLFFRGAQSGLVLEDLTNAAWDLINMFAGIVTFWLLIWGLLEWSSYISRLSGQSDLRMSMAWFPLPTSAKSLSFHGNPSLYESKDQYIAIMQFLSEQIQHAKALSSLSIGLGLPLRAFFETHRATIPRAMVDHDSPALRHPREIDILANLTGLSDPPILEFTPKSFIGRSFTFALEELGSLISEPAISHRPLLHGDSRLYAIYWRTASNLLLEYSAARPHTVRLAQNIRALRQEITLQQHVAESITGRSSSLRHKGLRHPATTVNAETQAFVNGLEVTLDNLHRLIAYLDWITEHLAQTTLKDVLKRRTAIDFSSCLTSLQELFAQSRFPAPKRFCFCWYDWGVTPPWKVDITIPGGPTGRAGR